MTDATIDSDQWRPYHIAGVVLVPLGYRGKVPMIRGWTTTAFDRRKTIKAAIRHKTNLGFRCDAGWIVVDYDSRRDPTGVQWARFLSEYEIDPTAYPYVETGGDGIHLYMRNPTGALVVGTLPGFDAIEFKAGPRQVVCAGSGHPNGKPYRWRAGTVALKDAPAIPDNLLAAITRPPVPDRVGQDEPGDLDNEQLARLLSGLDPCQYGDRDKWRNLSAACHHATNGHGFEAWEEWCAKDDRFDTEKDLSDRAALWKDFDKRKPTKVRTVATIYRALQDAGRRDLVPGRHQGIYAEWQKMNEADRLRKVVKDFENE